MAMLQNDDFNRLFTSFERTARRLEGRDRYDVPSERPYIDRWRAGVHEDPVHLASTGLPGWMWYAPMLRGPAL